MSGFFAMHGYAAYVWSAYAVFFVGCALIAVPSILLFWLVGRIPPRVTGTVNPA